MYAFPFQYSFFLLLIFFVILAAGISAYAYRRKLSEGFQVSLPAAVFVCLCVCVFVAAGATG